MKLIILHILSSLVQQGFLREIEKTGTRRSKKRYGATKKGLDVVRYLDRVKALLILEETTAEP